MYKSLTVLLLTLLLAGCVVPFLAGGTVTGAVVTEPRAWKTIQADETINYQVNSKLVADPILATQAHVSAVSYNRVVLLTGQAPNAALRQRAVQYARMSSQVRRIFNEIIIGDLSGPGRRSKDLAITAMTRTRMLASPKLKSNQFKIVTENGTVFILGIASRKQADLAVSVVQNTPGVQKVVRLIENIN